MQCWTLPPLPSVSESVTNAPPACAMTSRSPVASTTTLARIARRPCLLSKIAPLTRSPSVMADDDPGVQQHAHPGADEHLVRGDLQPLGVDHRRLADRVAERRQALAPVRDLVGIGRAPQLGTWTRDGAVGEAVEQLGADARDDLRALPVGHPVDPDDEASRREATEVAVALHDGDALAQPPRGDRGRGAGGSAADDEHVGLLVDGRLARRLGDRGDRGTGRGRGGRCVLAAARGEPGVPAGEVALGVGLALCSVSCHHGSKGCRSLTGEVCPASACTTPAGRRRVVSRGDRVRSGGRAHVRSRGTAPGIARRSG